MTSKKTSKNKKHKSSSYWLVIPVVVFMCAMVGFGFILFASNSKLALERALINTFDRGRQQSGRYQGSVVLDESNVRVDFNGQIASTGERSFGMGLVYKGEVFKLDVVEMQDRTYVRLQRPSVLLQALEGAPGVGSIRNIDASLLDSMSGSWVSLSENELSLVTNNIPCMDSLPTIGINANERSQQYFPFAITQEPRLASDGSNDRIYEVTLREDRKLTAMEQSFVTFLGCLEGQREADPRLRPLQKQDIATVKLKIRIDPARNIANTFSYSAFSNSFELMLKDFNRDVAIEAPEQTKTLQDVYSSLTPSLQVELLTRLGVTRL